MIIEKCQENHDALACGWIDIFLKIYLEKYESCEHRLARTPAVLSWWVFQGEYFDPKETIESLKFLEKSYRKE